MMLCEQGRRLLGGKPTACTAARIGRLLSGPVVWLELYFEDESDLMVRIAWGPMRGRGTEEGAITRSS